MVKMDLSEILFVFSYLDHCYASCYFFPPIKRDHINGDTAQISIPQCSVLRYKLLVIGPLNQRGQSACLTVSLSESNLRRPSAAGQIRARPSGQSEKHHCHRNHSHSVNLASSATAWPRGHLTESRPGGLRG